MADQSGIPRPDAPFLDERGNVSQAWYRFLWLRLSRIPNKPVSESTLSSPWSLIAQYDGFYAINGGTVSAVELSRNGSSFVNLGSLSGPFPVKQFDILRATYSVAPSITFFRG